MSELDPVRERFPWRAAAGVVAIGVGMIVAVLLTTRYACIVSLAPLTLTL